MNKLLISCGVLMALSGCATPQQMVAAQLMQICGKHTASMTTAQHQKVAECFDRNRPAAERNIMAQQAAASNPATYGYYPAYQPPVRHPVTFTDCTGIGNSMTCTSY